MNKSSVKSFIKKAGCNGSVIQRPKALVARLQRAKVCAIYRAWKVPLSISEAFKKRACDFFERCEHSSFGNEDKRKEHKYLKKRFFTCRIFCDNA
jgi:hypothetical protein